MWSINLLMGKLAMFLRMKLWKRAKLIRILYQSLADSVPFRVKNALSWIPRIGVQCLTMLYPISCYNGPLYNGGLLYIYIYIYIPKLCRNKVRFDLTLYLKVFPLLLHLYAEWQWYAIDITENKTNFKS